MDKLTIVVDFDGTCVTHEFPKIGRDIGAQPVLKRLVEHGHKLVLFTMRSDRTTESKILDESIEDVYGAFLTDAVKWFEKNEIPLHGIQYNPTQHTWTTSNKAYGQIYIDDAALGCPLKHDGHRPYADWDKIEEMLIERKIISKNGFEKLSKLK